MCTKPDASAGDNNQATPLHFSQDQVKQVQEAIRRAERDMNEWREKSRVDPVKMKQPLTR